MNIVKIGIIGIGNMGSSHLRCIQNENVNGMRVTAVCDINETKLNEAKEKYPDISIFKNYNDLLLKADVNAVLISVPHPLHSEIAIAAFKNKKHVLVEKPEDIKVSAAKKLNTAAKKSKKVFPKYFCLYFLKFHQCFFPHESSFQLNHYLPP